MESYGGAHRVRRRFWQPSNEIAQVAIQRFAESAEHQKSDVKLAPFNPANVVAIHLRPKRKLLLRPAELLSPLTDAGAKLAKEKRIVHGREWSRAPARPSTYYSRSKLTLSRYDPPGSHREEGIGWEWLRQ